MKNLKRENGAITIITLVSILFIVSFLVSSYILISNKVKAQKDIIAETRNIYESKSTMEEIYNSYFSNEETIPIYTVDQLLSIGSDNLKQISQANGKFYKFSKTANYVLMNDLEFKTSEWTDLIGKDEQGNLKEWVAIGEVVKKGINGFTGNFEGNGHKILVTDLSNKLHECNESNEYYYYRTLEIKIKPINDFMNTGEFSLQINHTIQETVETYGKESLQINEDGLLYFLKKVDYGDTINYSVNMIHSVYDNLAQQTYTYQAVPQLAKTGNIEITKDIVKQFEMKSEQIFRSYAAQEQTIAIPYSGVYELVLVGGGRTEDLMI